MPDLTKPKYITTMPVVGYRFQVNRLRREGILSFTGKLNERTPSVLGIARHQGCRSNLGEGLPHLRLAMTQRTAMIVSSFKLKVEGSHLTELKQGEH